MTARSVIPALEVRDLRQTYRSDAGSVEVLRGLSLDLTAGTVLAVLGPSGSGKSTLLHLLGALETPSSGEILWAGQSLKGVSQETLARRRALEVGLIFQHHYLLEDLTTLQNVMLPGMIAGQPDEKRAAMLLERVGLRERTAFYPRTLSGGERQRAALARALSTKPKLVLATNPRAVWIGTTPSGSSRCSWIWPTARGQQSSSSPTTRRWRETRTRFCGSRMVASSVEPRGDVR
jgi:lipoprotein-releasing system ATP-binding protein